MKLRVFQSRDGDCILFTGKDGKMVLADGGRSGTFKEHVAAELSQLDEADFEVVYISHIDADHVEGVERMLGDMIEWTRFDHRQKLSPDPNRNPPQVPRPMRPKQFWHNSFHDEVGKNSVEIVDVLAASAGALSALPASAPDSLWAVAMEHDNLATSMKQAFNISTRIRKNLLNIRLNREFGGKLMVLKKRGRKNLKVGKMKWRIIGPMQEHLKKLRKEWNDWLESADGAKAIEKVKAKAKEDADSLTSSVTMVENIAAQRAESAVALAETFLANDFGLSGTKSGRRNGVTTPNLASLMFLVEEGPKSNRKTVLMTGDGHWQDIIDGLESRKLLDKDGNLHVDVLKVPHHGATANSDPEFVKRIIADHYIFCGISKSHQNPEQEVVKQVLDSRLVGTKKSSHKKVDDSFNLWFTGSSTSKSINAGAREHMKVIEKLLADRSDLKFKAEFLDESPSFEIEL